MLHLASVHGIMADAQASMPAALMRRKSTEVSIVAALSATGTEYANGSFLGLIE